MSGVSGGAAPDAVKNLLHKFGIDRRIVTSAKHGVELPSDAPVLTAIFLYGAGDDEFSEYNGDLPGGLLFSDGREATIKNSVISRNSIRIEIPNFGRCPGI